MKPLTISDPVSVLGLQEEIRRSHDSRYDHRLHGVLLVAQGMSCPEVARLLGDSTRTVEYWVQRFEHDGLGGLVEAERSGRPRRLDEAARDQIKLALRDSPQAVGLSAGLWDGKSLSAFIRRRFKIKLGVRQCQRLFREFDFRLRKPRPLIAQADPQLQRAAKKNSSP